MERSISMRPRVLCDPCPLWSSYIRAIASVTSTDPWRSTRRSASERGRKPIREEAINVFMGLPGDGDRLELTYNHGVSEYTHGTGYNHIAITVSDMDETLAALAEQGIEP